MKKYLILSLVFLPFVASASFDKDLYYGLQKEPQVQELQEFLTEQGVYSGPITGNFFSLTLAAVKNFQIANSISPAVGYFGPKTRGVANQILAAKGISSAGVANESGSTTPIVTVPPKTANDVVASLQDQIKLLQQQLAAIQQQQQTLQIIQQQQASTTQQISQQTQTLQQIQQNTTPPLPAPTPVPQPVTPPSPPPPPSTPLDFSLSNGGDKTVIQGQNVTNIISVSLVSGSTQGVSFAVSGLPDGVTASFSQNSCSPVCTSNLVLSANTTATTSSSIITVTGTAGAIVHTTTFTLTVSPHFVANISFDKDKIANDGIDAIQVTIITKNSLGTILPNLPVLISGNGGVHWSQNLTSDSNGLIHTTIKTTEATGGGRSIVVSTSWSSNWEDYQNLKNYQVVNTKVNVPMAVTLGGFNSRAPAHDQIFATMGIGYNSMPQNLANLRVARMKFTVSNIDSTWISNIRITNTPPCTQGIYCTSQQTVPLPANASLSNSGLIDIVLTNPVTFNPNINFWIIADTSNPTSTNSGTGVPLVSYTISLNEIDFLGDVNYSDAFTGSPSTYPSTQITYSPWQSTFSAYTTLYSNYCSSSAPATYGQIVPCY